MALPSNLREFDDASQARTNIYSGVLDAVSKRFPVEDDDWKLELINPAYAGKQNFGLADQKKALLTQRSLTTPIRGTWRLTNKKDGTKEEREDTVMQVPFYSDRGTIINGGSEYSAINQSRLRPGVYVRRKRTGELETQFNVATGKGKGFRMSLEPSSGVFKVNIAQSSIPAYSLLKTMGISDDTMGKSWGPELLETNRNARGSGSLSKLYSRFAGFNAEPDVDENAMEEYIRTNLPKFEIDPDITARTLGLKGKKGIDSDVLRRATEKMLAVSRGEESADDRDAPEFKEYLGIEDLLADRVNNDAGRLSQSMLKRIRRSRSLKSVATSALTPYMHSFLLGSGLAMPLEESNPLHYLEQMNRVTGFGEGGIGSSSAITDDARELNPNQLGFLGTVEGPENERIGVDARIAYGAYKGNDRRIYGKFIDAKTGKEMYLRPDQTAGLTLGFSTAKLGNRTHVTAIRNGKTMSVPREEVDIMLPNLARQFAQGVNLNAMPTGMQAGRQFYAAKFWTQFLPLKQGELPLIDSLTPDGKTTFMEYYGRKSGVLNSNVDGTVKSVDDDKIVITGIDGKDTTIETVKDFPFNRLSGISYTSTVKKGDNVKKGSMVAHSNFTDPKTGSINFGRNLKTAMIPDRGWSNDDSSVISESASRKLATSRLYGYDIEAKHGVELGRDKYASLFPANFNKEQLESLDDFGIAKPGTILNRGDPIILALGPKLLTPADAMLGKLHKTLRNTFTDKAVLWEHDYPGTVTDSVPIRGGKAATVNVKAEPPVQIGDKLSSNFAVKGTVGKITPDDMMPRDAQTNEPYEVLFNPAAILSRVSPNQIVWMAVAKVAKKTGKQIRIPQERPEGGWAKWGADILKENGIEPTADIFDPESGKTVKGIGDGYAYMHSFHHLSEKKLSARGGGGGYDVNQQPAKGGFTGAKRFSGLDVGAMLSHGATAVLKDVFQIRGTRNDEYWKALRSGQSLPDPGVPFIYTKFLNTLRAGGINVKESKGKTSLLPMTDSAVMETGAKPILNAEMLDYDFFPRKGGLFDPGITGGNDGNQWSYIQLSSPVPNPVMEEPIRRVLGITGKQLRSIVSGAETLNGKTGGEAIKAGLADIDPKSRIAELRKVIKESRGNKRDDAVKAATYLDAALKQGVSPEDWVVSRIPVIPPKFRPISRMGDMGLVADLNELYKDLIETNQGVQDLSSEVDEASLAEDKLNVYDAVKAVYGLGDPITPEGRSKHLKGAIWQVTGDTPKHGMYQSKVIAKTVDNVARGVIGPDPTLDMDHIGLPEPALWEVYRDFIIRKLTRTGYPLIKATELADQHAPVARSMLEQEMKERPVIVDRAPTWHKFNLMGFYPVISKGDTIKVSPLVTKGFNADFDGDANFNSVTIRVKSPFTNNDNRSIMSPTLKAWCLGEREVEMSSTNTTGVLVTDADYTTLVVDLEDFPHSELLQHGGKDGHIEFFAVPPDVQVVALDPATMTLGWKDVKYWSRHKDVQLQIISLANEAQIYSDDDERAVLGVPNSVCKLTRFRPFDALAQGVMVPTYVRGNDTAGNIESVACPVVGHYQRSVRHAYLRDEIMLTREVGYALGAICGDGWSSDSSGICVAGTQQSVFDGVIEGVRQMFTDHYEPTTTYNHAKVAPDNTRYGNCSKLTINTSEGADLVKLWLGHRAEHKHLPPFYLSGCKEFREGLLAGIMDTDGTICVVKAKAKKNPQLQASMCSRSLRLAREVKLLAASLGMRGTITTSKTPAGLPFFYLSFSTPDVVSWGGNGMKCQYKKDNIFKLDIPVVRYGASAKLDLVPYPKSISDVVRAKWSRADAADDGHGHSLYVSMTRGMITGAVTRDTASRIIKLGFHTTSEDAKTWENIVGNTEVTWHKVVKVEDTGIIETGYDLTVPGSETFMSADGVILSNTMSFHVPVSDKAKEEVKEKLLPSRNLFSTTDLRSPQHTPRMELTMGMYLLTRPPSSKPVKQYASQAEAKLAYANGEIKGNDPIEIKS